MHPKTFHRNSKSNSFLMSISCRDPVYLSTFSSPISLLQKQWQIYLLFGKLLNDVCNNLHRHPYTFTSIKLFFLSVATFPRWAGKPVNLNIRQYQSERNSEKFSCCLEIQSKIAAIISLHPKLFKVRFPLWL